MRHFIHVYHVVTEFVVVVEDRGKDCSIICYEELLEAALKAVKESKAGVGPVVSIQRRDVPKNQLIAMEPETETAL